MQLATIQLEGRRRVVARDGEDLRDLTDAVGDDLARAVGAGADLAAARAGAGRIDGAAPVIFEPPVPRPERVLCTGFNFGRHAAESGRAGEAHTHPTFFVRLPSSHVGHLEALEVPRASATLDWEGEVAVVIGRGGRHIRPADALGHVAGYTCFGDHSVREFQLHSTQATAGKNFDRSGAYGPWLTTADEVADPAALTVVTRVNGEEMQRGRLDDLLFDIPALIAYASAFTTLAPGDVIACGTPSGIGARRTPPVYLAPGDVIEVEVPGVGLLRNPVTGETTP